MIMLPPISQKDQLTPKNITTPEITKNALCLYHLLKHLQRVGAQNICYDACIFVEFYLFLEPLMSHMKGETALSHHLMQ